RQATRVEPSAESARVFFLKHASEYVTLDLFRVRQLPFLTRRNYYYEVLYLLPWGLLAGVVEANISAVVAAKTFGGDKLLITVTTTTPVAAHLASLLWGALCVGRRKLRVFTLAASGVCLFTATVGLAPASEWGGWCFAAQMAAAQFFMTGVVTAGSALWKFNYPVSVRGRITARLQALRAVLGVVVLVLASCLFDYDPGAYRFAYPAVAGLGALGILVLQRIHVRGERKELRRAVIPAGHGPDVGLVEPFSLTTLLSGGPVVARAIRILRTDAPFRKYCTAQSLAGMSNLMMPTVMVAILANELLTGIHHFYFVSIVLLDVLPRSLIMASLPRWGRLFDRIGVVRFRIVNAVVWTASLAVGGLATLGVGYAERIGPAILPLAIAGFALRAILQGVSMGGGNLAWYIGHLHFARPEEAEVYMGLHVSLTGLRGLIMPSVGILLYTWIGWWVWGVAVIVNLLSLAGYASLARDEVKRGQESSSAPGTLREVRGTHAERDS
ncbi:MAG: hypothetical protein V2A79_16030, partial [Planctomycetota bacterium]